MASRPDISGAGRTHSTETCTCMSLRKIQTQSLPMLAMRQSRDLWERSFEVRRERNFGASRVEVVSEPERLAVLCSVSLLLFCVPFFRGTEPLTTVSVTW
jgi:hypothetical protein